jgi:hypothetical protein
MCYVPLWLVTHASSGKGMRLEGELFGEFQARFTNEKNCKKEKSVII